MRRRGLHAEEQRPRPVGPADHLPVPRPSLVTVGNCRIGRYPRSIRLRYAADASACIKEGVSLATAPLMANKSDLELETVRNIAIALILKLHASIMLAEFLFRLFRHLL